MRFPSAPLDSTLDFGVVGKMAPTVAGHTFFGIECLKGHVDCMVYQLKTKSDENRKHRFLKEGTGL